MLSTQPGTGVNRSVYFAIETDRKAESLMKEFGISSLSGLVRFLIDTQYDQLEKQPREPAPPKAKGAK